MAFNPMHDKHLPITSLKSGDGHEVLPDVYCLPVQIVNVYFVGAPASRGWVLVDAGMPASQNLIIEHAEKRFGEGAAPLAIVLTHGHFDHIGAVVELAEYWQVPVYAHDQEMPYLTGKQRYPGPDTRASGLIASLASFLPREPVDLGDYIHALPDDGSVPFLADWRWVHTPGHTPGHISFFREDDRALIAGDAVVTVEQEALYKVFNQKRELNGPPAYFTTDWTAARGSVRRLAGLKPNIAMTGHGMAMGGIELRERLADLAERFDELAVPAHRRGSS